MIRTNTVMLKPTAKQNEMMEAIADHSAILWNKINYNRRQCWFNDYTIDWKTNFYKEFTTVIGGAVAQQVFRKNNEAWKSCFALLKRNAQHNLPEWQEVGLPGYWKDRNTNKRKLMIIERNDLYSLKGEFLHIPLPKKLRKQYGIRDRIKIRIKGRTKWKGKQRRCEIIYDDLKKKWYAFQSVETKSLHQPRKDGKKAFVDLGVKNLITSMTPESAIIYSGKSVLAEWWYWNHRIAKHQSEIKTVNKKKTSKELRRLYRIRKRRFRHAVNAMVKNFIERCDREDVKEIVTGDVTYIRDSGSRGRKTNSMVENFWSFDYVVQRLKDKAEEFGMEVKLVDESYTSRTCPVCGYRAKSNRKHRGLFVCKKCGYQQNADIVGCLNIMGTGDRTHNRLMAQPLLLSWNKTDWGTRISRL